MLGTTPVFYDITKDTYNPCPDSLERQVKAVLAEGKLTLKVMAACETTAPQVNDYEQFLELD